MFHPVGFPRSILEASSEADRAVNNDVYRTPMTTPISALPEWVPEVLGPALGFVLSVAATLGIVQTKISNLEKVRDEDKADEREISLDLKDAIKTIQALAVDVRVVIAEQGVINKVTTSALDGVTRRLDLHDQRLIDL